MSAVRRNVANNMLLTCLTLLHYMAYHLCFAAAHTTSSTTSTSSSSSTAMVLTDMVKTPDDIMSSEARGSFDRMDIVSNLLPRPTNFLLDSIASTAAGAIQAVNLTRQHDGDVFWTSGVNTCNMDTCVGLSSGTASWLAKGVNKLGSLADTIGGSKSQLELLMRQQKQQQQQQLKSKTTSAALPLAAAAMTANNGGESCQCRCLPYLNTYREDLGICVDDIHECTLSPFVSGSSSEKIPFVFLPLRGQIIYPSREISFADIRTPVCAVTGAQYLTANGWSDLRNPIDTDYPFRMFRDEGRTFLQWLGEADLRHKMQGRLIVVHLVCRDMTLSLNVSATTSDQLKAPKNVFSPCVAFRVNGSPVKYANNVSEVLFQAETTATLASTSDGMSTKEYIVIGVCSLLLGLIYVSSVFLYLHMKKRKNRDQSRSRNSLDDINNEINYPKNDQVTFGAPFTRSGSLYSGGSLTTSNEPRSRASLSSLKEEMGIVKNNPLLQHFPQLNDHHSGFTSDISNSNSECEMDSSAGGGGPNAYHDKIKQMQTNALIHPQMSMNNGSPKGSHHSSHNGSQSQSGKDDDGLDGNANGQEMAECLPAENVAIIEEMMTEEKLENLRAMVNGNIRKKLYFNPAYFEPHLLAQPPPAALEFLQKIREVIAIAKYKMATKRYQPSLTLIPEEGSARSNTPSQYGSQLQNSPECHGCASNRCSGHVKNCGDKRNSIEKWLEMVQTTEDNRNSPSQDKTRQSPSRTGFSKSPDSAQPSAAAHGHMATGKRISAPKQKPPPPPTHKLATIHSVSNSQNSEEEEEADRDNQYHHSAANLYQRANNHQMRQSLNGGSMPSKLDAYSVLTASAHMYGFAETGGEIYNNPKFMLHDSPAASQRSRGSSQRSRKRLDVLDQYAAASTPTSLSSTERQHYNMLRNMEQLNDTLDAGTLERIHQEYTNTLRSNGSYNLDIPTPDYDSTMEKKIKDIYNNTQSSGPSVPTPDYSSLSRKSLKQYQPDSPIYRRKSPQYLIVDYETDSLERLEATKRKSSQSSSSPSSDVSSQLSPSLSTALPLEEEMEISNTVYQGDGFNSKSLNSHKKNLIRTLDPNVKNKDMASRIKYDTPFRGSMTIEVEHEPPSDLERSTDSDQYEPDTLDRKPKKQSFCDVNAWSNNDIKRSTDHLGSPPQSLPDLSKRPGQVEAQNSFRLKPNDGTEHGSKCKRQISRNSAYESQVELRRPCGNDLTEEDNSTKVNNLRDIYQSLLVRQNSDCSCKCGGQATSMFLQEQIEDLSDKGRILTLEAKHSRRQRNSQPPSPPPATMVEISNESSNKCTIKISTPKANRNSAPADKRPTEYVEPRIHQKSNVKEEHRTMPPPKKTHSPNHLRRSVSTTPPSRIKRSLSQSPQTPPPPPPPTSASTTLNSRTSRTSSNNTQHVHAAHSHTEEETMSNHSESTEVTGISGTMTNSEFGGTMDRKSLAKKFNKTEKTQEMKSKHDIKPLRDAINETESEALQTAKKLKGEDYGAIFNTHINGLRNDYSLNKYLNRRKSQDRTDDANNHPTNDGCVMDLQLLENNNNNNNNNNFKISSDTDSNKLDVVSLSSRSNRSSSRLSDRTKEMYRNAGVPVGIAYPQRSNANNNNNNNTNSNNNNNNNNNNNSNNNGNGNSNGSNATIPAPQPPANNVQTVYRCEIEPVQLTHGMQIAMGLKDRPKKAKDIKNAWKKFVSMAASKFSPTQSPAPPFDKKSSTLLEVLEKDEGIASLIEEHPQVSTPKSSYSAPASQNYYEQRFGPRPQEMDSGYMSADSGEAHKRTFYDRYNFKMMSERDRIIRVSTIEDNSDGDSTLTDRHKGQEPSARRGSILDVNHFEDFEHINEQQQQLSVNNLENPAEVAEEVSDNDSEKTLTRSNTQRRTTIQSTSSSSSSTTFTSDEDDEGPNTTSYGSSETDGETNVDDMWESGAESVETHSVLYKNIRKSLER